MTVSELPIKARLLGRIVFYEQRLLWWYSR